MPRGRFQKILPVKSAHIMRRRQGARIIYRSSPKTGITHPSTLVKLLRYIEAVGIKGCQPCWLSVRLSGAHFAASRTSRVCSISTLHCADASRSGLPIFLQPFATRTCIHRVTPSRRIPCCTSDLLTYRFFLNGNRSRRRFARESGRIADCHRDPSLGIDIGNGGSKVPLNAVFACGPTL